MRHQNIFDEQFPRKPLSEMSEKEWEDNYIPIIKNKNHEMEFHVHFEHDREFMNKVGANRVWAFVECENNSFAILPGYHRVNVLHYYVTQKAWSDNDRECIVYIKYE